MSLGEKDHPALPGILTAGRREGPPSHHPPEGIPPQHQAGAGEGKGWESTQAVFSRQALTFQQLCRAAAPFFFVVLAQQSPISLSSGFIPRATLSAWQWERWAGMEVQLCEHLCVVLWSCWCGLTGTPSLG